MGSGNRREANPGEKPKNELVDGRVGGRHGDRGGRGNGEKRGRSLRGQDKKNVCHKPLLKNRFYMIREVGKLSWGQRGRGGGEGVWVEKGGKPVGSRYRARKMNQQSKFF